MSEKLTYDPNAAAQAVTDFTRTKTALSARNEARETQNAHFETYQHLGNIAARSRFGRWRARKEQASLMASLPPIGQDRSNPELAKQNVTRDDESKVRYEGNTLRLADQIGSANYRANGEAYYDNAVIEANNHFIDQGSPVRIMTPDAIQEHADQAAALSASHQAQAEPKPVSMIKPAA